VSYDPTIYAGAAAHYRPGRPPYSPELEAMLTQELGLDGKGRLLARRRLRPGHRHRPPCWSAPHLFGARVDDFAGEMRELLRSRSPDGVFWDWPGDSEIVLVRHPG
jgi:hypothetical protein